jgi:hypothetical protein
VGSPIISGSPIIYSTEFASVIKGELRAPRRHDNTKSKHGHMPSDDSHHKGTLISGMVAFLLAVGTSAALWQSIAGRMEIVPVQPPTERMQAHAIAPSPIVQARVHSVGNFLQAAVDAAPARAVGLRIVTAGLPVAPSESKATHQPTVSQVGFNSSDNAGPAATDVKVAMASDGMDEVAGPADEPLRSEEKPFGGSAPEYDRGRDRQLSFWSTGQMPLGAIRTASATVASDIASLPSMATSVAGKTTQKPGKHSSLPDETRAPQDGSAVGHQGTGKSSAKSVRDAAPGAVPKADKNAKSERPGAGGHSTASRSEGVRKGPGNSDAAGRSGGATGNGASRESSGDKGQSEKDRGSKGKGKSDKGKSGKDTQ